ncbi:hypothetical protein KCU77_g12007, partial [Aureobasidium melanogenum]
MATSGGEVPVVKAEQIDRVERIINYRFQDHENAYLWEALQYMAPSQPSVTSINGRFFTGNNLKLAIIGDVVMAVAVAEYWFSITNSVPGDWGDLSTAKLSNKYFNKMASQAKLVSCTECCCCGGKKPANLLEAIIGAVYLDSGRNMGAVRKAMISVGSMGVLNEADNSIEQQTLGKDATAKPDKIVVKDDMANPDVADLMALYDAVPVSCT